MYTHKPQLLDVRPSDWRTHTHPQTDGCTPTYQTVGSTSKKPSILSDWQLHTYNIQHIRLMAAQLQISDWQIYNHKAQYIRLSDVHPQRPTYQTFGHTAKISEWRTLHPQSPTNQIDGSTLTYQTVGRTFTKPIRLMAAQPQRPTHQTDRRTSTKTQHIRLTGTPT